MGFNIAITGSGGFIGGEMKNYLQEKDHNVIRISRNDIKNTDLLQRKLENVDVIINLAGAPVVKRWTRRYKKVIYDSRINTTKELVKAINSLKYTPDLFLSASAIGIYENNGEHTEDNFNYGSSFLAHVVIDWEKEALKIGRSSIRTVLFRFGIVLGRDGGILKHMVRLFRVGMGSIIDTGNQSFSFIHIKDVLRALQFVMDNKNSSGIYNLVSPKNVTSSDFSRLLAERLKRPILFNIPEWIVRFFMKEGATMLTEGQKVIPAKLEREGFNFRFQTLDDCLNDLI
ncbi:MAG: TIGR01777 family oxidoreductase [Bacteroidales bacterium]|nr:MAG: TIGR01777 family oxidoreductase [Bacteroidales bacterium]